MTEKTNGSKEFWKGIQANCDHADEALERILNRYPYMRDNADWHDIAALINGIRMMSFELEPDEEKPPAGGAVDGQTGKDMSEDYPSLF